MLFKFHKYLYIICLQQPWAPCVTNGIVYHNLQFASPNEIFIPNIIPSCLASLTASWFTSQVLWAIRMAIISVCWVNFQTSLIFVCGYQWMYIVDQLIIDQVLFTFQQMSCICLTSNVSRLKKCKGHICISINITNINSTLENIKFFNIKKNVAETGILSAIYICDSQTKLH